MRCRLHYAEKNLLPDPRWRGKEGVILCRGRGPGPRNVLVRTLDGDLQVLLPQAGRRTSHKEIYVLGVKGKPVEVGR